MTPTRTTWKLRVERGPNWLIAKATQEGDDPFAATSLAETLWVAMERNWTYRVVLELDERQPLDSELLDELISLDQRARAYNGFVRLCGLAKPAWERLRRSSENGPFAALPCFDNRRDAVFGYQRPKQPR